VYFIHNSIDGPGAADQDFASEWLRMTGKEDMVMYGSSYPHWHAGDVAALSAGWTDDQRGKVLYRNAARLYGLELATAPTA
jgi:predicted TIM-barrel fold metal-dependent hydrolase